MSSNLIPKAALSSNTKNYKADSLSSGFRVISILLTSTAWAAFFPITFRLIAISSTSSLS